MKITIIISAVVFIYIAFSTIFYDTRLAGNIGNIIGKSNIELFGYLAYINIFLLFYPLYRLYKNPALAKQLDFYAGWLLFFISMIVLPALIFDKPGSGMLSDKISVFLLPYIGKAGMWLFWLMILSLSLVLIVGDDFSLDFLKRKRSSKEKSSASPKISFKPIGVFFKKLFSNPFAPAYDDVLMPALDDTAMDSIKKPVRKRKAAATARRSTKKKSEYVDAVEKSIEREESILQEREKKYAAKKKRSTVKKAKLDEDPAIEEILETENEVKPAQTSGSRVQIVDELEENSKLMEELDKGKIAKPKNFKLPKLDFLQKAPKQAKKVNEAEIDRKSGDLIEKLKLFNINGDVVRTYTGPLVTTFEFKPAPNVKVSKILGLQDDLAMALSAETIRIQAPIPGRDVVGIEIPNESSDIIYLREILESELFQTSKSPLTIALGKDIVGKPFITDIKKLPHLLIAGTTGSGKSVGINAMILSLLYKNDPEHLKLMMIDPKMLEFSIYDDIPHLITPVITEPKKAIAALANMVGEMERRYRLMADKRTKNIDNYNEKVKRDGSAEPMPFIVIIIDELADLMMNGGKEVENSIARLAQKSRACGIHLIVATQRPSVDVVTGIIKANLPSRLSYRVGQKIDSKVILDGMGAESLLGRGDGLFTPPGTTGLVRIHAPWATEEEIEEIVEFIKAQRLPEYDESYLIEGGGAKVSSEDKAIDLDPLYEEAKAIILSDKKTSISYLQRKLQIGYNRSANIIDQLQKTGVLSEPNAKGNREIL